MATLAITIAAGHDAGQPFGVSRSRSSRRRRGCPTRSRPGASTLTIDNAPSERVGVGADHRRALSELAVRRLANPPVQPKGASHAQAWSGTQKTNLTAVETAIDAALLTCGSVNDPWQQGVRQALLGARRLLEQVKVERNA
jgi:hypothetical protein